MKMIKAFTFISLMTLSSIALTPMQAAVAIPNAAQSQNATRDLTHTLLTESINFIKDITPQQKDSLLSISDAVIDFSVENGTLNLDENSKKIFDAFNEYEVNKEFFNALFAFLQNITPAQLAAIEEVIARVSTQQPMQSQDILKFLDPFTRGLDPKQIDGLTLLLVSVAKAAASLLKTNVNVPTQTDFKALFNILKSISDQDIFAFVGQLQAGALATPMAAQEALLKLASNKKDQQSLQAILGFIEQIIQGFLLQFASIPDMANAKK